MEGTGVIARNFRIEIAKEHESIYPLGAAAELFSDFLKMDEYSWIYNNTMLHPDMDGESLK